MYFFCTAFFRLNAGKIRDHQFSLVYTFLPLSLSFFQGTKCWRQDLYNALVSNLPGAGRNMHGKPATCCCCRSIATFHPTEGRRSGLYRSYRKQNFQSPSPQQTSGTEMWHSFTKVASHYTCKTTIPSLRLERTGSPSRWVAYFPTLATEHN